MRVESGRVNLLLVAAATALQAAGLLALHHIGVLQLSAIWRLWPVIF